MDLGNRLNLCICTKMYLFRCVPNRNPARHLVGWSVDIIQWKCSKNKQKKIIHSKNFGRSFIYFVARYSNFTTKENIQTVRESEEAKKKFEWFRVLRKKICLCDTKTKWRRMKYDAIIHKYANWYEDDLFSNREKWYDSNIGSVIFICRTCLCIQNIKALK